MLRAPDVANTRRTAMIHHVGVAGTHGLSAEIDTSSRHIRRWAADTPRLNGSRPPPRPYSETGSA